MAALPLPEPGTKYGPCLDESCGHKDCECNRKAAACICRICKKPAGYGVPLYDEWNEQDQPTGRYDYSVHARCLEDEVSEKLFGGC